MPNHSWPRRTPEQSQTIEPDDDGGPFVAGDTEWQRQRAEQVPEHQYRNERRRDDEVGDDDTVRPPSKSEDRGHCGQIITDDDDIGSLQRQIRTGAAHRDPNLGRSERGRVVDPVADHSDSATASVQGGNGVRFALREQFSMDVNDAHVGRDAFRGFCVVTGQQDGTHSIASQSDHAGGRVDALRVAQSQHCDSRPVVDDDDRGVASRFGGSNEFGDLDRRGGVRGVWRHDRDLVPANNAGHTAPRLRGKAFHRRDR